MRRINTVDAGEAKTIIAALLLGMTLPVTPIQILWINLITAITLGIALAFEPTEDGTITVAQFAIPYAPPLQSVFGTQPVPFLDGVLIVAVGATLFAIVEIEKQMRLRLQMLRAG